MTIYNGKSWECVWIYTVYIWRYLDIYFLYCIYMEIFRYICIYICIYIRDFWVNEKTYGGFPRLEVAQWMVKVTLQLRLVASMGQ